jgi:hypothetical protein
MVLPRAGATVDWTPNILRRNVPRFHRAYFVLPVNDFARCAMTRESSGSLTAAVVPAPNQPASITSKQTVTGNPRAPKLV